VDARVGVGELVTCVGAALGTLDRSACPACDPNKDGSVSIDELIAAVGKAVESSDGAALESCLRDVLGIPAAAERVVILGQSSHLDWDWLRTFEVYFQQSVDDILNDALDLIASGGDADGGPAYSLTEVGYLERFVAEHPDNAQRLRNAGRRFRVLGGGITSPDNLLPEGEAFIRNYLVGRRWTESQGLIDTPQAWLPDDFGHDAQLPVVLRAMGLDAVGFARVPGIDTARQALRIDPPTPGSLADRLLASGVDFTWRAADGSEVMGHWLARGYGGEANDLDRPLPDAPALPELDAARVRLRAILEHMLPASHTPYVFVPVGSDFDRPKKRLVDYARAWNEEDYPQSGVFVVAGSFDDYARLVAPYRDELPSGRFDPTPYWTGHIATRPEAKTLHVEATRALLAAETLALIANGIERGDTAAFAQRVQTRQRALDRAWDTLVPSTHHDFVNGTSTDQVTHDEQIPLLREALMLAEAERETALDEIAGAVAGTPAESSSSIVVVNPLGFPRRGLVETGIPAESPNGQRGAGGVLLFLAETPSLGYTTIDPVQAVGVAGGGKESGGEADGPLLPSEPAVVDVSSDRGTIVVANAALRAEIRRDVAWGLVSVVDRATGREMIAPGEVANDIVIYEDQGGLYRFGNEMARCGLTPNPRYASVAAIPEEAEILEAGPLRVVVRTRVQHEGAEVTRVYTLVADEPFLRIEAVGAAPAGTSVMVHVPLAGEVDELVHGTPSHWDAKAPERGWYGLTFEAVHDFAMARAAGHVRGAVFRAGVSAWAATSQGLLIGVLWRNANFEKCDVYGPAGTDPDPHVIRFALRVPSGLGSPESGTALRESLSFANPLLSRPASGDGRLPPSLSIASVPLPAILTAVKPAERDSGGMVLRIYQPSNDELALQVESAAAQLFPNGSDLAPVLVTALENPVSSAEARDAELSGDAGRFDLVARHALSTILLAPRRP
jgi:alpha-mannosidase